VLDDLLMTCVRSCNVRCKRIGHIYFLIWKIGKFNIIHLQQIYKKKCQLPQLAFNLFNDDSACLVPMNKVYLSTV